MVARGVGGVESGGALRNGSVALLTSAALCYQTLNVVISKVRIAEESTVGLI
jgi:hypothetical protein